MRFGQMPEVLSGPAHAKVNLVLEVLGKREDGYHDIDTILQEIELADRVSIEPAAEWRIEVTGPRAAGTPADESNLALKAAMLLAERVNSSFPCLIRLEKHIPAAGGLGGGASDAAAALGLLASAWPSTRIGEIVEVAEAIGSDEAFFLHGGTARARGRGEQINQLQPLPAHDVVLFVPPQTIERKTARMFAELGKHEFDVGRVAERFAAHPPAVFGSADVFNAFERVAFDLFPWLAELWQDLEQRIGEPVRLAGAGPCLFWIGPSGEGSRIAAACTGAACEVIATHTTSRK
jgi:4-diphosphocytidyl-2-C-methyl-D-erythritol kinase